MIDLYVLRPEDKEGVQVNLFDAGYIATTIAELVQLVAKHHLVFMKIELAKPFDTDESKNAINLQYANGEYLNLELKHNQIVFYDENKLHACYEEDLESRFGLTTDHRKIERDF